MSDRQPPSEFSKAIVEGVGMLALVIVGMLVMSGIRSGDIRPAEIAAEIPVWKETVMSYVPLVLGSAAALLVSVLVAVLASRYGRAMVSDRSAVWWRYKRRWADAMAAVELTGKPAKTGGPVRVPALRGASLGDTADVLTVRMLPGQTLSDWHDRAPVLARRFGATSGRIEITTGGTASDVNLVFERTESGPPERKALEAPASATVPGLILDPAQAAGMRPERVAMRAWSLQIVWARLRVGDDNDSGRWWFGGRVRWNIIDRNGYYLVGGA
ncbi:hypothetical protein [Nocardia carnea]|uniref:hypothetical protein n=1 Tax=Nocardia carnea TaxID=37328 RepID=UPI00245376B9|nr:hypothetical protein [Nocardia carnea]